MQLRRRLGGGGTYQNNLALEKIGPGTLNLAGTDTYGAGATLSGGTLSFGDNSLGTGQIVFAGGTLQWAPGNTRDVSSRFLAIGSGETAVLDTNGNEVTLASAISGAGGLTKTAPAR